MINSLGTTFDYEHAIHLGLDWKATLQKIINLKYSPVRIGIKWNKVEKNMGEFDWKIYDELFNTLDKTNIEVILCIGMKSPRWPEFFIPDWIKWKKNKFFYKKQINFSSEETDILLNFIKTCLNRYLKHKNIKFIQVENEPFLPAGPNKYFISEKLLQKEIDIVKSITNLPIILNDQGLPTTGIIPEILKGKYFKKLKLMKMCDILGLNIYPIFEDKWLFGKPKKFSASKIGWKYLNFLINQATKMNKKIFITELQAEPWQIQKVDIKNLERNISNTPEMTKIYINKLSKLQIEKILLWGSEFLIKTGVKLN